jgi:hypothetical protein
MPPATTMERIAAALSRLGEVTEAVQNTSLAVTHVANHHEVIGKAAHLGVAQLGRVADAAMTAGEYLAGAAVQAAASVDRMASAADRVATVIEQEAPRFVRAVEKLAGV